MMSFTERVNSLGFLDLRPRETEFVAMVARHGGYCLARQYADFVGRTPNAYLTYFFQRLVDRKLARRIKYQSSRAWVYHIGAARVYEALGQTGTRHRVGRDTPTRVARRIMLLDFVLAHRQMTWYVSEADKARLFKDQFGVPEGDLPRHRIYAGGPRVSTDGSPFADYHFHDKWPVYVNDGCEPRRVHFVVLAGFDGRSFSAFLVQHARLLAHLPAWTVVVVTPQNLAGLSACQAAFQRAFPGDWTGSTAVSSGFGHGGSTNPDLTQYFQTRRALESGGVASVSVADFDRYRDARMRFLGPEVEQAYADWCVHQSTDGDGPAVTRAVDSSSSRQPCAGALESYRLPFSYALFGDFAGDR